MTTLSRPPTPLTKSYRRLIWGNAIIAALLIAVCGAAPTAHAQAATPISRLPFTIKRPGNYVLKRDLTFGGSTGNAITVAASDVNIDLGGRVLANKGEASTTTVNGIFAEGQSGISVRNGTVRGFLNGLLFNIGTDAHNYVISGVTADRNAGCGMLIKGDYVTVRDCIVTDTGGTTVSGNTTSFGIYVDGYAPMVIGNSVSDVRVASGNDSRGIQIGNGAGGMIEGNRVVNIHSPVGNYGIIDFDSGNTCIVNNRVINFASGITITNGNPGKYRDNLVLGATTGYTGGTNAGNNQ